MLKTLLKNMGSLVARLVNLSLVRMTRHVMLYTNLKQAVDSGLVLTKIHRVVEFNQRPWMKDFIDFNINKRKESKMNSRKVSSK